MIKKATSADINKIKKIKKVDVDEEKGSFFFLALIGLLIVGSIGVVLFFAANRETALNVAPEVNKGELDDDHWHFAYSIYDCGELRTPVSITDDEVGIHTHGQGLLHIHPNKPEGAGPNAQFGRFMEAIDSELTDDTYTPGGGQDPEPLSEEAGCDGKPATLKLAYWEDAYDDEAEPATVIEEDLAGFRFSEKGGMVSLALVAEGEEVPRPPVNRVVLQAETDGIEYQPSEDLVPTAEVPASEEGTGEEATDDSAVGEEATDDSATETEIADETEPAEEDTDDDAPVDTGSE